jgi:hypothetical protein
MTTSTLILFWMVVSASPWLALAFHKKSATSKLVQRRVQDSIARQSAHLSKPAPLPSDGAAAQRAIVFDDEIRPHLAPPLEVA